MSGTATEPASSDELAVPALTADQAEQRLLAREFSGMHFGLERIHRLLARFGNPQRRLRTVHIVGTNGKSSTTRMIAAILQAHGLHTGAYLSPHLSTYRERIEIDEQPISPARFASVASRVLALAAELDKQAAPDDHATQFELLTVIGFLEMAEQGVDVGVIEAGLGGRYDATNVIDSEVQVLTGVGLEHTRWLGPTIEAIAREKLDVVRPGKTLVLGAGMHPDAIAVARERAGEQNARIITAPADTGLELAAKGEFQQRNFATAITATRVLLGADFDESAAAAAAVKVRVPGRMQIVGERPLTVLDGGHNPDGIAAVMRSLPEIFRGKPLVAVVSVLDDKNAAAMLAQLAPACAAMIITASHNPRALAPAELARLAGEARSNLPVEIVAEPHAALARARESAGPGGGVLATGSIYLVADLLADPENAAKGGSWI
jgi:dihydrofolate synthase/folylpolyglutamate synthase